MQRRNCLVQNDFLSYLFSDAIHAMVHHNIIRTKGLHLKAAHYVVCLNVRSVFYITKCMFNLVFQLEINFYKELKIHHDMRGNLRFIWQIN